MTAQRGLTVFAPAKVNLYLQIVGRRADGYHLLDSLAVFPDIGDAVFVEQAAGLSLSLSGPFAANLGAGGDNLALQAAAGFQAALDRAQPPGAALTLHKNLPIASGIGGGSADAAAVLRGLSQLWDAPIPADLAARLGSDVPVCVPSRPAFMRGVGDDVTPADGPAAGGIVLVNPLQAVPTPAVFAAMTPDNFSGEPPAPPPSALRSFAELVAWLTQTRNDMTRAAVSLRPVIRDVLTALEGQTDCALARMSGSGATCFGLFADQTRAAVAAQTLRRAHPDWWIESGALQSHITQRPDFDHAVEL